jgi:hypothetical protein
MIRSAALLFTFFAFFIPAFAAGDDPGRCKIAESVFQQASSIRGLKILRPVPCEIHDKKLVEKYIRSTIDEKMPPGRLVLEEEAYKILGFIPDQFSYQKGIVDLYLSQIGGYYDPEKRHYIMAGWLPDLMQTTVAAHELTHALQDQHFNLGTFMDMKKMRSDALMARSALVEGDATAVMFDYTRKQAGLSGLREEQSVDSLLLQNIVGAGMVSALNQIPQSLQMMLLFPYTSGLRFVHGLLLKDGYHQVDGAFKRPPRSTEEILHLDKYFKDAPDFVEIGDAEIREGMPADAKDIYTDTYGEFAVSALLAMSSNEHEKIAKAAEGWGGDRAEIFDEAGKHFFVWKTHWDSAEDAREFYEMYSAALKKRFAGGITKDEPGVLNAAAAGRSVSLVLSGEFVTYRNVPAA